MFAISSHHFEWARLIVGILTLASIIIALLTYRSNRRKVEDDRQRERDKEYAAQFQRSLEWAYGALTENGRNVPPEADRLNWLTAARHLLRAKKIQDQIAYPTYRTIADEIEEFWRHRFYIALQDRALMSRSYFENDKRPKWPENIEITSALVVVDFSNWRSGAPDPTDAVDREYLMTHGAGTKGGGAGRGLQAYIRHLNELREARKEDS